MRLIAACIRAGHERINDFYLNLLIAKLAYVREVSCKTKRVYDDFIRDVR